MYDCRRFFAYVATFPRSRPTQILTLSGELDFAACASLQCAIAEIGDCDLIVNLADVSFIDAAGLGCLVALHADLASRHRTATLRGAAPRVFLVFAIVGLTGLLETPPTPHPTAAQPPRTAAVPSASGSASYENPPQQRVVRATRSGRMVWQSPSFVISARVTLEPPQVHVTAVGDFSTPGSTAVLHGALSRLSRFRAPIQIDCDRVTNTTVATARVFRAHRPDLSTLSPGQTSQPPSSSATTTRAA